VTHSSKSRKTAKLSDSLHKRVNLYALAGSAAGVGMLALGQPAEAKVIYTPKHLQLTGGKTFIDLNHDGINDFYFSESVTQGWGALSVIGVRQKNLLWGDTSALPAGVRIGSSPKFHYPGGRMASVHVSTSCTTGGVGPWTNVKNRYLGLKFYIKGRIHFGWARLTVITGGPGHCGSPDINATLTGYAYETIPNKSIITGKTEEAEEAGVDEANPATLHEPTLQPPSLGLLAMGSPGLTVWRREESLGAALEGK
jgi:hypothetical protein